MWVCDRSDNSKHQFSNYYFDSNVELRKECMQTLLKEYDHVKVDIFIKYIERLRTDKKDGKLLNWWAKDIKDADFAHLFEKVAAEGLWLDGETISIQFRKKLILSFGYQAYKNKVTFIHKETVFDMQLVKAGDVFSIEKQSGKVIYSHKINDPFALPTTKNIVGAYCIIKNHTGEFYESMGLAEIEQCKKTSLMQNIWSAWYGEMALKTVIKRGCKRHFADMFSGIEKLDNEGYDVDLVNKDRVDRPLEKFKELVTDRPDADELEKVFKTFETREEKLKYYSQIRKEIKDAGL